MINRKSCPPGLLELLNDPVPRKVTLHWDGPVNNRYLTCVGVNLKGYTVNVSDDPYALARLLLTESVPQWLAGPFDSLLERGV